MKKKIIILISFLLFTLSFFIVSFSHVRITTNYIEFFNTRSGINLYEEIKKNTDDHLFQEYYEKLISSEYDYIVVNTENTVQILAIPKNLYWHIHTNFGGYWPSLRFLTTSEYSHSSRVWYYGFIYNKSNQTLNRSNGNGLPLSEQHLNVYTTIDPDNIIGIERHKNESGYVSITQKINQSIIYLTPDKNVAIEGESVVFLNETSSNILISIENNDPPNQSVIRLASGHIHNITNNSFDTILEPGQDIRYYQKYGSSILRELKDIQVVNEGEDYSIENDTDYFQRIIVSNFRTSNNLNKIRTVQNYFDITNEPLIVDNPPGRTFSFSQIQGVSQVEVIKLDRQEIGQIHDEFEYTNKTRNTVTIQLLNPSSDKNSVIRTVQNYWTIQPGQLIEFNVLPGETFRFTVIQNYVELIIIDTADQIGTPVIPTDPTNPNRPGSPNRGDYADGILGELQYSFANLIYIITLPFTFIAQLLNNLVSWLNNSMHWIESISAFFTAFFSFLPAEIVGALTMMVFVTVVFSILKLMRG